MWRVTILEAGYGLLLLGLLCALLALIVRRDEVPRPPRVRDVTPSALPPVTARWRSEHNGPRPRLKS